MKLEDKLSLVLMFQKKYPDSHVGGSIGLFLHGIDLGRSLDKSDIDMTIVAKLEAAMPLGVENTEESSHPGDFDYQFRHYPSGSGSYSKLDINVLPEKEWVTIEYAGNKYNVSLKADILFWKQKYAVAGSKKHIDDLITMATGIRPDRTEAKPPFATLTKENNVMEEVDDLPF